MKNEHISDGPVDSIGYFHLRFTSGLEVLSHVIRHDEYAEQTSDETLLMFRPIRIVQSQDKAKEATLAPLSVFSDETCVPFTTDDLDMMLPLNTESVIRYLEFLEVTEMNRIDNAFDFLTEVGALHS